MDSSSSGVEHATGGGGAIGDRRGDGAPGATQHKRHLSKCDITPCATPDAAVTGAGLQRAYRAPRVAASPASPAVTHRAGRGGRGRGGPSTPAAAAAHQRGSADSAGSSVGSGSGAGPLPRGRPPKRGRPCLPPPADLNDAEASTAAIMAAQRVVRRRQQNRASAMACRLKRRDELGAALRSAEELTAENMELRHQHAVMCAEATEVARELEITTARLHAAQAELAGLAPPRREIVSLPPRLPPPRRHQGIRRDEAAAPREALRAPAIAPPRAAHHTAAHPVAAHGHEPTWHEAEAAMAHLQRGVAPPRDGVAGAYMVPLSHMVLGHAAAAPPPPPYYNQWPQPVPCMPMQDDWNACWYESYAQHDYA